MQEWGGFESNWSIESVGSSGRRIIGSLGLLSLLGRWVKGSGRWGTKLNERQGPEQGLFLFSLQRTQGSAGESNHISTTKATKGTRKSKENDAFGKSIVHGSLAGKSDSGVCRVWWVSGAR